MENKSESGKNSSCWTKCIAITALSISLLCLGILIGQCMSNCSSKKSKCKTKSYKDCKKSDAYSGSTCTYEKKEKECSKELHGEKTEKKSELIEN